MSTNIQKRLGNAISHIRLFKDYLDILEAELDQVLSALSIPDTSCKHTHKIETTTMGAEKKTFYCSMCRETITE